MTHKIEIGIVVLLTAFVVFLIGNLAYESMGVVQRSKAAQSEHSDAAPPLRRDPMIEQQKMRRYMAHPQVMAVTRLLRTILRLDRLGMFPSTDKQARDVLPVIKHLITASKLSKQTCSSIGNYLWKIMTPDQRGYVPKESPSDSDLPMTGFDLNQPFKSGELNKELRELVDRLEKRLKGSSKKTRKNRA